jgi:hypothetical protein
MKNQVLDQFKVEELEQRLEMKAEWSASVSGSSANGGSVTGTVGVKF